MTAFAPAHPIAQVESRRLPIKDGGTGTIGLQGAISKGGRSQISPLGSYELIRLRDSNFELIEEGGTEDMSMSQTKISPVVFEPCRKGRIQDGPG